jgi:hypothetical protein
MAAAEREDSSAPCEYEPEQKVKAIIFSSKHSTDRGLWKLTNLLEIIMVTNT